MRLAPDLTILALTILILPLPLAAQGFPPRCTITQQCAAGDCTDDPGVTLVFDGTATGLVAWDASTPHERIALVPLSGDGPAAWTGRAPDLNASMLLTRLSQTDAVITMHSEGGPWPFLTARLTCGEAPPPLTKRSPA